MHRQADANYTLSLPQKQRDSVIISYNTQSPAVNPGRDPIVSDMIGIVINPVNWMRDTTLATNAQGLGSYMPDSAGS